MTFDGHHGGRSVPDPRIKMDGICLGSSFFALPPYLDPLGMFADVPAPK
jgi:hypothetical protein